VAFIFKGPTVPGRYGCETICADVDAIALHAADEAVNWPSRLGSRRSVSRDVKMRGDQEQWGLQSDISMNGTLYLIKLTSRVARRATSYRFAQRSGSTAVNVFDSPSPSH